MLEWWKQRRAASRQDERTNEQVKRMLVLERRVSVLESRVAEMVARGLPHGPGGAANDPWRVMDNDIETLD